MHTAQRTAVHEWRGGEAHPEADQRPPHGGPQEGLAGDVEHQPSFLKAQVVSVEAHPLVLEAKDLWGAEATATDPPVGDFSSGSFPLIRVTPEGRQSSVGSDLPAVRPWPVDVEQCTPR